MRLAVKNEWRKNLAVLLSALMIFVMMPSGFLQVKAAGSQTLLYIDKGSILIGNGTVFGYDSNGNPITTANSNGYIITQTESGIVTANSISVTGGNANITLNGVNISASTSDCAFSISSGASVSLTLVGDNTLLSGDGSPTDNAGIGAPSGASLSITGTDADTLTASSGGKSGRGSGAGIGGGYNQPCGTINISGGNINATSFYAAGIGGGMNGNGGTVNITGGSVTASGYYGAGIGGGYGDSSGNGGIIHISGGNITAGSTFAGAGIGGGSGYIDTVGGTGGNVTITGGTVFAHGGRISAIPGADIGGGGTISGSSAGAAGTTVIAGGTVFAGSITGIPTNGASANVYPVSITLPSGTDVSALSITQNGSAVPYGYQNMQASDSSYGQLYFWLPSDVTDETSISVTSGGKTYAGYHGSVKSTATMANPNVLKMNQSALTVTNLNGTYVFGNAILPSVAGGSGTGAVTFDYSSGDRVTDYGTDYPTAVGNYSVTATRAGDDAYYSGTSSPQPFSIVQKSLTADMLADIPGQLYTGSEIKPEITVKDGNTVLTENTDYTVSYSNNINAGTAAVTVTGKGNYSGSINTTFTIIPSAGTIISKPSSEPPASVITNPDTGSGSTPVIPLALLGAGSLAVLVVFKKSTRLGAKK